MHNKKSPYGRKKRKQRQKDMWRIENTRLKISQEWKSHCHMTVPERDLAGVVAFIQCESQRIEVCTQIAEERHLPSEQNIAAEVQNKNAYQQQAKKVRRFSVKSRFIQHSSIFAACRFELEYKDKKRGRSPRLAPLCKTFSQVRWMQNLPTDKRGRQLHRFGC